MGFFDFLNTEKRNYVPVDVSDGSYDLMQLITMDGSGFSSTTINVTIDEALKVPAVWAAVNFLSGTMAGLPLHLYKRNGSSRERIDTPLASILGKAINDETTSFDWRKKLFESVFTGGRHCTLIDRANNRSVKDLWPLISKQVEIKRTNKKTVYIYRDSNGPEKTFSSSSIIDIVYMFKEDGVSHRGPIATNKDAIALAIAANKHASKFFNNGGVPPFIVKGKFQSPKAMDRAQKDLEKAVKTASAKNRLALVLPDGLEIVPLGVDAEKSQLIDTQRFCIEQVARVYQLPPVFLQDLTHGTFSNTEQQDLQLVKHTIKRWVEQTEQQLNLKLFGRSKSKFFVEFAMDGLLRGDFKTRMDGYAVAVQNSIVKPNEVRAKENLPDAPGGDRLYIQGATVPTADQTNSLENDQDGEPHGD